MNPNPEPPELLDDVLAEGAPADFRATMLAETLRAVRHRRRWRNARRGSVVIVALALIAILVRRDFKPQPVPVANQNVDRPFHLVQTQPLPASSVIQTVPFAGTADDVIAPALNIVLTTPNSGGFNLIDDDQLLALVAARPAILVRVDANSETLVFANPNDEKNFLFRY